MSSPVPHRWLESALVAALTFVGAILRFWNPGRLGLNHFDEGAYAIAGLWITSPRGLWAYDATTIAYAPPGFPILVGLSYLFLGISDVSAILVSQVCGVMTIPAVAWVGRRTFGPGAGAAAAAFVTVSGPHIAFSRMALVESTFLFCWVLALGYGARFVEKPGLLRAIPFGLMVGLAQNVKYNGWLAGAIVAITLLWGLVVPSSGGRKGAFKGIAYGLLAALIAAVIYWPWYRFVDAQPGGYAALLRHHRAYLDGPSAWLDHWRTQMGQQIALSGTITTGLTWGAIAWAAAWLGGWIAAGWPWVTRTRWQGLRLRIGLLGGLTILGCAPNAPWWVSLAMLPWLLVDRRPAARVVGATWLVMAVLTPLYHPYARLWLPLHAAGWLILAGLIVDWGPSPATWAGGAVDDERRARWLDSLRRLALAGAAIAALASDTGAVPRSRPVGSPIGPTDGLRTFSAQLASGIERAAPQRIQAVTRPTVLFYLQRQTRVPIVQQSSPADVSRSFQPGDFLLIDSLVEGWTGETLDKAFPEESFNMVRMNSGARPYMIPTPPATLLDSRPGIEAEPTPRLGYSSSLELMPIIPR